MANLFPQTPAEQADRFFTQAMEWLRAGSLQAARQLLERAVQLNAGEGRPVPEGYARLALGRVWLELGEPNTARGELELAAARLGAAGDPDGQVRVLFELGELAEREGDRAAAQSSFQQVLSLDRDGADAALAHLRLAALFRDAGEPEAAAAQYASAASLFAATGNELGEARASLEEARLLAATQPDRARTLFERGRAIAEAYAQDELASVAHLGLAGLERGLAARRAHLAKARSLARDAGDEATLAKVQTAELAQAETAVDHAIHPSPVAPDRVEDEEP
ncbi:MAG TPA: hypothetical protein VER55_12835 [Ardenticatenaceae bacterium]|nr:hypothetical protein [Ardenticatenaceae bacterium]